MEGFGREIVTGSTTYGALWTEQCATWPSSVAAQLRAGAGTDKRYREETSPPPRVRESGTV